MEHHYPTSHFNHLSASQAEALVELKDICRQAGYQVPSSDYDAQASYDETLLRFLRARKFVPKDAFQQYKATEDWRSEQDIDSLYKTIDMNDYEAARRLNTQWTGRRDKSGLPLFVLDIAGIDVNDIITKDITAGNSREGKKLPPKMRRLFAIFEFLGNFVLPLCSSIPSRPFPETPVSTTTNIVNVSGVGIRQFWTLRQHLQEPSTLATAHYPEAVGRIFIVGAPFFFTTIWSWIKAWFDPGTVAKIFILSQDEVKPTLEKFIEHCDIPKRYGGSLDWEFGQLPNLDPEILKYLKMKTEASTIPIGPVWLQKYDDKVEARALGTSSGTLRDEVIAEMSPDIFLKTARPTSDTSTH